MEIKKIVAVGAMTLLAGATLTGCVSQGKYDTLKDEMSNLSSQLEAKEEAYKNVAAEADDYKAQLETINEQVVDKEAQIANLKVMIDDLNESLSEAKATTTISASGVENVDYDELDAYYDGNFSVTVDDGDLNKLIDGTIEFDDKNIDVKEEITITDQVSVKTSTTEEDFCALPYMIVGDEKAIKYAYKFEEDINVSDISESKPLKIKFLGKDLEIVEIDDNELSIKEGKTAWILQDNSVDDVTLVDVAATGDSAGIKVGEKVEWIDVGDSYDFGSVTVRVNDVKAVYSQLQDQDMAEVTISNNDVIKKVEDDDDYDADGNWKWKVDITGGILNSLGVEYDVKSDDLDDDIKPLKDGESIVLPESYVKLTFQVPTLTTNSYEFEFEEYGSNDIPVIEIKSSKKDGVELGTEEVDQIWYNGSISWYEDNDGDEQNSTSTPKLVIGDSEISLSIVGDTINVGSEIDFKHTNFSYLGNVSEDNEDWEVVVNGANFGNADCEVVSTYGIVVDKDEDEDKWKITIPEEQVETHLIIQ